MLAYVGFKLAQVGPSWLQVSPKLIPSWSHVGYVRPSWPQVAPKFVHVGPSWPQVGPKLAQVCACWPKLAQVGPKLVPIWTHVGSCWLMLALCWPISQGVANARQGVHEGFASKAYAFQDVHEGSAFTKVLGTLR